MSAEFGPLPSQIALGPDGVLRPKDVQDNFDSIAQRLNTLRREVDLSERDSLPENPTLGQEVNYRFSANCVWKLRWDGSAWDFVGGSDAYDDGAGASGVAGPTGFLTTGKAELTLPFDGAYAVEVSADIQCVSAGAFNFYVKVYDDGVVTAHPGLVLTSSGQWDAATVSRTYPIFGVGAGSIIDTRYQSANAGTGNFLNLVLAVRPIRVTA